MQSLINKPTQAQGRIFQGFLFLSSNVHLLDVLLGLIISFLLQVAVVRIAILPASIVALASVRRTLVPASAAGPVAIILALAIVRAAVIIIVGASGVLLPFAIFALPVIIVPLAMIIRMALPMTLLATAVIVVIRASSVFLPFAILTTPVVIVPLLVFVPVTLPAALLATTTAVIVIISATTTTAPEAVDGFRNKNGVNLMNNAIARVDVCLGNLGSASVALDLDPGAGDVGLDFLTKKRFIILAILEVFGLLLGAEDMVEQNLLQDMTVALLEETVEGVIVDITER